MLVCLQINGLEANSVDPDQTPRSAASVQELQCLFRPFYLKTKTKMVHVV